MGLGKRVLLLGLAPIAAAACIAGLAMWTQAVPASDRGEFWLARRFARELDSSMGLVAFGHERAIKAAIAIRHKGSCFVIGSSRIMTVRSSMVSAIVPECHGAFNLGVSGGSLEDDIAFAGLATGAKAVIFGIDHWSFKFGADDRFTELLPAYNDARCRFGIGTCSQARRFKERLRDVVIDARSLIERQEFKTAAQRSDVEAVTLPDASHVYSAKYLREMHDAWNEAHLSYKLAKPYVQEEAIEAFGAAVDTLTRSGTKVRFLLMPYHPRAARCESAELCKAMRESADVADAIAAKTGAIVCGSYFSGPTSEDFMSDMFVDPERLNLQGSCK